MDELSTTLLRDDFVFLEGPRWREGRLWVSDMFDCKVHTVSPDGTLETIVEIPHRPSGIGFLPDGTPLIVSMTDRRVLRLTDGVLTTHADLATYTASAINDMVVDDSGRAYIGNFGFDIFGGEQAEPGTIISVECDGNIRIAAEGLDIPNGTVITDNGRVLVVAETRGGLLTAFDRGADGALSNRRVYAALPGLTPDGICLDRDGAIWVASFRTREFVRVLEGGEITSRIDVAPRRAVACQLGGDDGRTLFCLTLDGDLSDAEQGARAARIETARVDVAERAHPDDARGLRRASFVSPVFFPYIDAVANDARKFGA